MKKIFIFLFLTAITAFSGKITIDFSSIDPLTSAVFRGVEKAFDINEKGLAAMERGDFEAAQAFFAEADEMLPINSDAKNNLGVLYLRTGRIAEAQELWRQVVRTDPEYAIAYINLGFAAISLGEPEEAKKFAAAALAQSPSEREIWSNAAFILFSAGDTTQAIKILEKKIPARTAVIMLAEIYAVQGDYEKAKSILHDFANPDEAEIAILLQEITLAEDGADNLSPADSLYNLALNLHLAGKLDSAALLYRKLLAIDRRYYRAWNNLGAIYGGMGELRKAVRAYKKAASRRSDIADGYANLVNIYLATENERKAQRWLRRGLKSAPDDGNLLYFRGKMTTPSGDNTPATPSE